MKIDRDTKRIITLTAEEVYELLKKVHDLPTLAEGGHVAFETDDGRLVSAATLIARDITEQELAP
jgi:hypothetical protein